MSLSTSIRCWIADLDAPEPDPTFAVWMRAAEALESENTKLRAGTCPGCGKGARSEADHWREECLRLENEHASGGWRWEVEKTRLESENARLREALELAYAFSAEFQTWLESAEFDYHWDDLLAAHNTFFAARKALQENRYDGT